MKNGNQVLLACMKAWLAGEEISPERLLGGTEGEESMFATDGGLNPALGYLLSTGENADRFPSGVRQNLDKYRHYVAANNAVIFRELDGFLERARGGNLDVLLLKGLALIKGGVYPRKGMRLLSDMDIFVKREDLAKVEGLMEEMGWTAAKPESELHENHHLPPRYTQGGVVVEVHFAFSRFPLNVDVDKVWERTRRLEDRPAALIPSVEDTLLHLVINAALHHPEKLVPLHFKFVVDFGFIWRSVGGDLDWDYLSGAAAEWGIESPFWNAMNLCETLLEPPGLRERIRHFGGDKKADGAFVRMLADGIREGRRLPELSWLVALAGEEKSPLKRLYKLLRALFPPRSYMYRAYPDMKGFPGAYLAYLLRIVKVIRRFDPNGHLMAYRAGKAARSAAARSRRD